MGFGGSSSFQQDKGKQTEHSKEVTKGTKTSQLELDEEAITQIIKETLGSATGLASIFNADNAAGVYNSTASKAAAGDLVSNLVGELAKITGKQVENVDTTTERDGRMDTTNNTFNAEVWGQMGN